MAKEILGSKAEELKAEIMQLESGKEEMNRRFWRASAFTASSVLAFVVSIIAIDIGVPLGEAYIMEVIAAASAVSAVGGAAFAQGASGKLDKLEEQASQIGDKMSELTTEREIGMTRGQELAGQKAKMAEIMSSRSAQKGVEKSREKVEVEGPSSGRFK
ncbi:MAG: hypothetical protein K0R73_18 [Candidatus Midichloriaceae bacterium]|jgi:hypothetical protein|nr:hypothetical protein [Candidatus Midichloriaceae bacterium]